MNYERGRSPVIVLGDSVLWGYKLPASDAASIILARRLGLIPLENLSYEGGSDANSYFMLRYILSQGIRPKLVIFGVNSKETNAEDSAYNRLQPSLERDVLPLLTPSDRQRLSLSEKTDVAAQLDSAVSRVWALYRYRTDIREALFGTDDASLMLNAFKERLTGSAALQAAAHRPTPDKFLGTYDLAPLDSSNVDLIYLRKLGALLQAQRIPAIAFLTPTNHHLLSDYINTPEYDQKLEQLAKALRGSGIAVLDLDRSIPGSEFIDNDHLTVTGNELLAKLLWPAVQRAVQP